MADIQLVTERLNRTYERFLEKDDGSGWNGRWVREVHVVSSGGECKELLVWMDREWNGGYSLICREDGNIMEFTDTEVSGSAATYPDSTYARYLFEPGKSLTKAGVFNAICNKFGLVKLARFTHLYTFPEVMTDEEAVVLNIILLSALILAALPAAAQQVTRSEQVPGLRPYKVDLPLMTSAEKDSVRMVADLWKRYVASFTTASVSKEESHMPSGAAPLQL